MNKSISWVAKCGHIFQFGLSDNYKSICMLRKYSQSIWT